MSSPDKTRKAWRRSRAGDLKPCKSPDNCPLERETGEETFHSFAETFEEAELEFENYLAQREEDNPFRNFRNPVLDREAEKQESLLKEALRERRALTSEELAERSDYIQEVTDLLKKNGLETSNLYSTSLILDNGQVMQVYTSERIAKQEEIISKLMEKALSEVPREGKVLAAGGLGGAGKSTVLKKIPGISKKNYFTINPDEIKELMAESDVLNSGNSSMKFIPEVKGLTPMEASTLVHEEASQISRILMNRLSQERVNLMLDKTMGSAKSMKKDLGPLRDRGYTEFRAVFVDISPEVSQQRGYARYVEGMEAYTQQARVFRDENLPVPIGGRPLPKGVISSQLPPKGSIFRSKNAEALTELQREGYFTETPLVFDNSVNGAEPFEIPYRDFLTGKTRQDLE